VWFIFPRRVTTRRSVAEYANSRSHWKASGKFFIAAHRGKGWPTHYFDVGLTACPSPITQAVRVPTTKCRTREIRANTSNR
jgi:hypothetical protein